MVHHDAPLPAKESRAPLSQLPQGVAVNRGLNVKRKKSVGPKFT
jgi:hypothetical protein